MSTSSEPPFPCPSGCGDVFSTENGAVMHAINKSDEQHSGVNSKTDGYQLLGDRLAESSNREAGDESSRDPPEDPPEDHPEHHSPDQSSQSRGSNPVMGGASPETSRSTQSQSTSVNGTESGEPVCLDCGGELVDFTDLETGYMHDVQGVSVFVGGDYICSDCGEWWNDE